MYDINVTKEQGWHGCSRVPAGRRVHKFSPLLSHWPGLSRQNKTGKEKELFRAYLQSHVSKCQMHKICTIPRYSNKYLMLGAPVPSCHHDVNLKESLLIFPGARYEAFLRESPSPSTSMIADTSVIPSTPDELALLINVWLTIHSRVSIRVESRLLALPTRSHQLHSNN